jgi:3-oxoacyl-(acyl-carrier-protein) synthase
MRRVAVTGLGIICPIGNSTQEVTASLHDAAPVSPAPPIISVWVSAARSKAV